MVATLFRPTVHRPFFTLSSHLSTSVLFILYSTGSPHSTYIFKLFHFNIILLPFEGFFCSYLFIIAICSWRFTARHCFCIFVRPFALRVVTIHKIKNWNRVQAKRHCDPTGGKISNWTIVIWHIGLNRDNQIIPFIIK